MDKTEFNYKESDMTPVAKLARSAYCNNARIRQGRKDYGRYYIPAFDGGVSADGRNHTCLWERVANKLNKRKFDVDSYVEYVFGEVKDINSPTVLMSDKILDKYQLYVDGAKNPNIWELEDDRILTEITIKKYIYKDNPRVLEMVLLSDNIDVSPLSRYAFGCRQNERDMVKVLEKAAFNQFLKRRFFYERFYSDRIPEEFLKKVN